MPPVGYRHSPEVRKRISEAKRAHPTRYWLGKHRSVSTLKVMRSVGFQKGHAPWNKGTRGAYSDETRMRISDASRQRTGPKAANWKGGLPNCADCGKQVWYYSKRCYDCNIKYRSSLRGKLARTWKGGVTPIMLLIRHCRKMREWRKAVFERDDYTCSNCGVRGRIILHADHYPRSFASIIRKYKIRTLEQAEACKPLWNVSNGRTLCEDCHRERHTVSKVDLPLAA